ncbi:transcriptional regulator [Escherichia coli]|nr:transcriptional regulator [Escherichia coli]EFL9248108.1 transcriptional regulator [Escherichia coli]EGM8253765.1 transcriptional regulator [Escherichia coli]EHK3820848.1 transcriptional regulator [Escherichia coli]EHW6062954.1 transcriptional regulator [Escherichia coli]
MNLTSGTPGITPFSPKNGKPALSPHHDWLKTGSQRQNAPLRIWFYPQ